MTTSNRPGPRRRRPQNDGETHLFAVGQSVRMKTSLPLAAVKPSEIFQITATLPPTDNSPQYRIRNDEEKHERVITQDKLELVSANPLDESAALSERTFAHG